MRQDILAASLRVLRDEGPLRFTTQRIAAVAGVSVGSLYQYFPNKEAIVLAIRSEMVERGWNEAQRILEDPGLAPREKIRRITRLYFLAATQDRVEMGAGPRGMELYFPEDAYRALNRDVLARFTRFLTDALEDSLASDVAFKADLLFVTLENLGQTIARRKLSKPALERWADATADMVCSHIGLT